MEYQVLKRYFRQNRELNEPSSFIANTKINSDREREREVSGYNYWLEGYRVVLASICEHASTAFYFASASNDQIFLKQQALPKFST